jgi:ribulose-phosphate 3-epimerase
MQGSTLSLLLSGGPRLTVGVVTADLLHLGDELSVLEGAGIEMVHVDVGDGVFSPLFTVGPPFVKAMTTSLIKDVHLMVEDPLDKIDAFVAAGADMITFQVEGARQPHRVLQVLGEATNANDPARGIVRGVAINPSTPVAVLEPLLSEVEYILILAINPGWGGQAFLPSTPARVEQARRLIEASGKRIALGVDGGVTFDNVAAVARLDIDLIVSGSAIFDGNAAAANAASMLEIVRSRAGAVGAPVPA